MLNDASALLFPNFETFRHRIGEVEIAGVQGGSGPPLLLLHGHPQSHLIWHRVAPTLADHFTVIATDLRGKASIEYVDPEMKQQAEQDAIKAAVQKKQVEDQIKKQMEAEGKK